MLELIKIEKTVCPQCTLLQIMLDAGEIEVDQVHNVDHEPEIVDEYDIQGVPVLLFKKDGEVVDRIVGTRDLNPEIIKEKMEQHGA
jgi:thiol-disulfide isomerase/thioredoxin